MAAGGVIPYLKIGSLIRFDFRDVMSTLRERYESGQNRGPSGSGHETNRLRPIDRSKPIKSKGTPQEPFRQCNLTTSPLASQAALFGGVNPAEPRQPYHPGLVSVDKAFARALVASRK